MAQTNSRFRYPTRNASAGAFEIYDISHSTLTGAAGIGAQLDLTVADESCRGLTSISSRSLAIGLNDVGLIGYGSKHIDFAAVRADGESLFDGKNEMNRPVRAAVISASVISQGRVALCCGLPFGVPG